MSEVKQVQAATLLSCGAYEEHASVTLLARPRGRVELRVDSRLASAREPGAPHVRYRVTLDREGLLRLRGVIDAALNSLDQAAAVP